MTASTLPLIPNPKKTLPKAKPTSAAEPAPKKLSALETLLATKGGGKLATANRAHGVLSTGLKSLDRALGGGLPKGQISEFAGDSGVGKTTLAMKIVAEAQERGELCAWLDVEQSFDEGLALSCGLDLDALIYDNPAFAEEATEFVLDLIETGAVSIIVVDSIGAYNPKKRLEDEVGKVGQPALRAKAVGELQKLFLQFKKVQTSGVGGVVPAPAGWEPRKRRVCRKKWNGGGAGQPGASGTEVIGKMVLLRGQALDIYTVGGAEINQHRRPTGPRQPPVAPRGKSRFPYQA